MRDEDFMRIALDKAAAGVAEGQSPFGACIVNGGKVVSCEHNAVWAEMDITAHAEIRAIRAACKALGTIDLSGCVIYSTTEPCPMCFSACHWARLDTIVYGAAIADARATGFHELTVSDADLKRLGGSSIAIRGGILREENIRLLREWADTMGSKAY